MVPMRAAGEFVGALVLANDKDRRPFDDFDRDLARRLAERAAIAIQNARLASERSRIAETLQRGLAPPSIPEIPGWATAAVYRPAGSENRVGGDFYDFFRYHAGWMLVIGDVTGRGAEAAAVTALARYTLRTAGTLTGDPVSALRRLNESLRSGDEGSLCTAAIVTVPGSDDGGAPTVAIAGHPPPLLVRGGAVEEMGTMGPVLGAFDDADWSLDGCPLEPGHQLVLYTDGVIEASGEDGRFGEETLRSRLAGSATPAATVSRIVRALEAFTHGDLDDDIAIVALMRDPAAVAATAGGARDVATA
jgi:serine phosphatase RsbU (regulator of sigma subunit)